MKQTQQPQEKPQPNPVGYVPYCPPEEDTIDLYKLWQTLVKYKFVIVAAVVTALAAAFVTIALTKPVYQGKVSLELGEAFIIAPDTPPKLSAIDNGYALKEVLATKYGIRTVVAKRAPRVLTLTYTHSDKETIRSKLREAVSYIETREKSRIDAFMLNDIANIRPVHLLNEITVGDTPIKPKTKLIVIASVTGGLVAGILLALLISFVNEREKENGIAPHRS